MPPLWCQGLGPRRGPRLKGEKLWWQLWLLFGVWALSLLLAIESSCDDTSVALMEGVRRVKAWALSSQIKHHSPFGGVVPEYAGRMHLQAILPLVEQVLQEGGVREPAKELSAIAVTAGPGLIGSLFVGVMAAKALCQSWNLPLIAVNHLEGHLFAPLVEYPQLDFPYLALIVSGGHTELMLAQKPGHYQRLAETRDDAAGEAFDKLAKTLGMGYPGGPLVQKAAEGGNPKAFALPRPRFEKGEDFSFSGLKTAALDLVNKARMKGEEVPVADLCASFQAAVVDCLVSRVKVAVERTGVRQVALSGGVAANGPLRAALAACEGFQTFAPKASLCTDNAVMIGAAGAVAYEAGFFAPLTLQPTPQWQLSSNS